MAWGKWITEEKSDLRECHKCSQLFSSNCAQPIITLHVCTKISVLKSTFPKSSLTKVLEDKAPLKEKKKKEESSAFRCAERG